MSDPQDLSCAAMLRAELVNRCRRNGRYSSRAFARDIGISPSYLTQLLSENRACNQRLAAELTAKLRWPDRKVALFMTLSQRAQARSEGLRQKLDLVIQELKADDADFKILELENEAIIAQWEHGAILEMTELQNFQGDSCWIARKLGISQEAAERAVDRLLAHGLLVLDDEGRLCKSTAHTTTPPISAATIRKKHKGLLEKGIQSLDRQCSETRDYSSIIMAIDPDKIATAKIKIEKFRRELMTYLESGNRTELHQLSVQLFRLDRHIETGDKEKP